MAEPREPSPGLPATDGYADARDRSAAEREVRADRRDRVADDRETELDRREAELDKRGTALHDQQDEARHQRVARSAARLTHSATAARDSHELVDQVRARLVRDGEALGRKESASARADDVVRREQDAQRREQDEVDREVRRSGEVGDRG
jgi:hypothetical protein